MKRHMHVSALVGIALLAACMLLPLLPVPEYWITLLNYTGIYALPVLGLVLLTGFARITSLAQAAFAGIGSYTTAVLAIKFGVSPWVGLVAGVALVAVIAFVIGLITMRLSGHFLTLATMAWGLALFYLFSNLEFLGKYDGLTNVPPLRFGELELTAPRQMYYLIWIMLVALALGVRNLLNSRIGRAIQTLQGGNVLAESMGINSQWLKMLVFVLAATLAAVSGFLYTGLQRAVNPTPFGLNYGIEYLFMAVVGGMGQVWGALIGASLITILKDGLQSVLPQLLGGHSNFEMVVLGVVMVLILQYTRSGVWGVVMRFWPQRPRTVAPLPDQVQPLPPRRSVQPPRADATPLLDVRQARKAFGELVAVNDVSFSVARQEIVGLIGPNGAGKSTLFNLVSGVLPLDGGEVDFAGERISGCSSRQIMRKGIARTFQHVKLMPHMTVLENVAVGAHLRGHCGPLRSVLRLDRREEAQILAEAVKQIERVGLEASMNVQAGNLALGQQRVVEIARALASDPLLLLLDEPAAGLRYMEKQALAQLLSRMRMEGMSILLVEHDMDFVMNLTDRLVVMEYGRRIADGTPQQVQNDPAVLQAYLGGAA